MSTRRLIKTFFLCVSLFAVLPVCAQEPMSFPEKDGETNRYSAYIEFKEGYLSGVCILKNNKDTIMGSIFNEFGISALDFTCDLRKEEIKLLNVASVLNKWYIKKVLKEDLRQLIIAARNGKQSYQDTKYGITMTLTPMPVEKDEEDETVE